MAVLPVIVAVDVDPDYRTPGMSGRPEAGRSQWRGLTEGVPRMLKDVEGLADSRGTPVRFTWLLRSDEQMAETQGDPASVAEQFMEFWRRRLAAGDEIGWHPHLWRHSEQHRVWFQELHDTDWIHSCLREGHAALSRHFRVRTAKSGWTYHSEDTMQMFSDLGVQVDISGIPGMRYEGRIPGISLPLGVYDWSRAPQEPYHPHKRNYQMPGNGHSLPIIEIPNRTFPVGRTRALLHRLRGRSARDFANPAKLPSLVKTGFGRPPLTVPFVCYFHPEELLGHARLFGAKHVADNLRALIAACEGKGMEVRMTTPSELFGPEVVTR